MKIILAASKDKIDKQVHEILRSGRKILVPKNFRQLPIELTTAYASIVLGVLRMWVYDEGPFNSKRFQEAALYILSTAKQLGLIQNKPISLYRKLTFSEKSFIRVMQKEIAIKLKPRKVTSWTSSLSAVKHFEPVKISTGFCQFIIRKKISTPYLDIGILADTLNNGISKDYARKHGIYTSFSNIKRESEILVYKNGGITSINKKDIIFAGYKNESPDNVLNQLIG